MNVMPEDGATHNVVEIDHVRLEMEKKFLDLRQTLKARISLKKLIFHGGYFFASEKECKPTSTSADTGILDCSLKEEICIQDSASLIGGVCAKIVRDDVSLAQLKEMGIEEGNLVVGGKALKPFSMKDKLIAQRILKRSKASLDGYTSTESVECNPGTNDGFVDVIGNCDFGRVCVHDPYSNIGGTCVNVGNTSKTSHFSQDLFQGEKHRHLLACTYRNGTSGGEKCSGHHACGGLSAEFVASNIGCGSCNAYGACTGLTGKFSIAQHSAFGIH